MDVDLERRFEAFVAQVLAWRSVESQVLNLLQGMQSCVERQRLLEDPSLELGVLAEFEGIVSQLSVKNHERLNQLEAVLQPYRKSLVALADKMVELQQALAARVAAYEPTALLQRGPHYPSPLQVLQWSEQIFSFLLLDYECKLSVLDDLHFSGLADSIRTWTEQSLNYEEVDRVLRLVNGPLDG